MAFFVGKFGKSSVSTEGKAEHAGLAEAKQAQLPTFRANGQ
jgi:hypothetical protein